MTKKHFIKIAAILRAAQEQTSDREVIRLIAEDLCYTFRDLNSNFDRARFMAACGF